MGSIKFFRLDFYFGLLSNFLIPTINDINHYCYDKTLIFRVLLNAHEIKYNSITNHQQLRLNKKLQHVLTKKKGSKPCLAVILRSI